MNTFRLSSMDENKTRINSLPIELYEKSKTSTCKLCILRRQIKREEMKR